MLINHSIGISSLVGGLHWKFLSLVATCVGAYLFNEFLLDQYFELPGLITTVLGTAIAFFIGFNNNQAYSRWWEARIIWGGLVNDSRTWARQVLYYNLLSSDSHYHVPADWQKKLIRRHIAFVYALKEYLRGTHEQAFKKYLSTEDDQWVKRYSNKHNAILALQSKDLGMMKTTQVVDGFQFQELNKSLIAFCDEMGKSERIRNTVFPTMYIRYTYIYIWIFVVCLTIVMSNAIGMWAILVGVVTGVVYISTHHMGKLLKDPFNENITGIPLDQISRTIEINLLEMIGTKQIPEAIINEGKDYVM